MKSRLNVISENEEWRLVGGSVPIQPQEVTDYDTGKSSGFLIEGIGRIGLFTNVHQGSGKTTAEGKIIEGPNPGIAHLVLFKRPLLKRLAYGAIGKVAPHFTRLDVNIDKTSGPVFRVLQGEAMAEPQAESAAIISTSGRHLRAL